MSNMHGIAYRLLLLILLISSFTGCESGKKNEMDDGKLLTIKVQNEAGKWASVYSVDQLDGVYCLTEGGEFLKNVRLNFSEDDTLKLCEALSDYVGNTISVTIGKSELYKGVLKTKIEDGVIIFYAPNYEVKELKAFTKNLNLNNGFIVEEAKKFGESKNADGARKKMMSVFDEE